jgi:hypothetical protein
MYVTCELQWCLRRTLKLAKYLHMCIQTCISAKSYKNMLSDTDTIMDSFNITNLITLNLLHPIMSLKTGIEFWGHSTVSPSDLSVTSIITLLSLLLNDALLAFREWITAEIVDASFSYFWEVRLLFSDSKYSSMSITMFVADRLFGVSPHFTCNQWELYSS